MGAIIMALLVIISLTVLMYLLWKAVKDERKLENLTEDLGGAEFVPGG